MSQGPIIDYAFYTQIYKGLEVPPEDFDRLLHFASGVVDSMLFHGITRGIVSETSPQWPVVQRATAMQVEDIQRMGGLGPWLASSDGAIASTSSAIGSQSESVTYATDSQPLIIGGYPACEMAASLLGACGLTYWCRRVFA